MKKIISLERKIAEYSVKYFAANMRMDLTSDEIAKLSALDEGGLLAPLQARLDRLTSDIMENNYRDPLELGPEPGFLSRPFYFYGGYVALTSDQLV